MPAAKILKYVHITKIKKNSAKSNSGNFLIALEFKIYYSVRARSRLLVNTQIDRHNAIIVHFKGKKMAPENSVAMVHAFVEKINAHEVAGLCALMADDHVFVDSRGTTIRGRETMRAGWMGYFTWFPDYQISVTDIFVRDHLVGLFGLARGTYSVAGKLLDENKWEIPAAWRAVVKDGLIAEWRVYADNSPVLRIMEKKQN